MNLKMIGLAVFASLALSAGMAAAQMQPIPNPPEKPKAAMHHHGKHHAKRHGAKHHAMAKTADADKAAPAAPAPAKPK